MQHSDILLGRSPKNYLNLSLVPPTKLVLRKLFAGYQSYYSSKNYQVICVKRGTQVLLENV